MSKEEAEELRQFYEAMLTLFDRSIDLLLEKGIITPEQYDELMGNEDE